MLKTLLATPTIAVLLFIGTSAYAQDTCGNVCTADFWQTATQIEIEQELQAVNVNARNMWGETPLYWAALRGTPENIKALLEAGADVNARNEYGETPLYSASVRAPENIKALLEAGANVNARNVYGWTPLHHAAQWGTPEGIKALLEAGADGAAQNNDGEIPFDLAKGNEEVKGTDAYWALNDARFK